MESDQPLSSVELSRTWVNASLGRSEDEQRSLAEASKKLWSFLFRVCRRDWPFFGGRDRSTGSGKGSPSRAGSRQAERSICLSKSERDAIYETALNRFPAMGDGLWLAIQTEDFDAATDAAGEMRDLLELILSGVGWGRNGSAVTPSMDLLAMMRALERLNLPWRSKDLSRAERDEIYAAVQGRLRLMGDLWIHVGQGDFANADRLAREFVDLLHLIPGELGWGGEGVTTELRLSEARLQRTFGYLREITAEAQLAHDLRVAEARARERASAKTTSLVLEVCERVLSETES